MGTVSKWSMGLVIGTIFLVACAAATPPAPTALAAVVIKSYQGKDLTAASSLPDNSIAGPQQVDLKTYTLGITGLVDQPQSLSYDQVLARTQYSKVVILHCVEGWDATILWEGVRISDLLAPAGVQSNAVTVIFHAADGYTSSLPLRFILDNNVLLAYKMNGITLPAERGFPFQVVAEDKFGYKWVKWVTQIELSSDPNYRGYWEQRGYTNNGNLTGPAEIP
jgi:DMSO/TMAO reductase YedYZ molybdopterin-dependent catalytic subunit